MAPTAAHNNIGQSPRIHTVIILVDELHLEVLIRIRTAAAGDAQPLRIVLHIPADVDISTVLAPESS